MPFQRALIYSTIRGSLREWSNASFSRSVFACWHRCFWRLAASWPATPLSVSARPRTMRTRRCLLILALLSALVSPSCHRAGAPEEVEIVGSARFHSQVHEALLLLKSRDADAYTIVTTYVKRIEEGKHSGMWAYKVPPTYEMSDVTAYYSLKTKRTGMTTRSETGNSAACRDSLGLTDLPCRSMRESVADRWPSSRRLAPP